MTSRALALLVLLVAGIPLVACEDGAGSASATSAPTEAPTPSATPEVRLTGDPALDAILAAVADRDVATLTGLIEFQRQPCAVVVEQIGGPPRCPFGVEDGTLLEVFPVSGCEGAWSLRPAVSLASLAHRSYGLYAAVEIAGSDTLDHALIFHSDVNGDDWGLSVGVADGRIVALHGGCVTPPADLVGLNMVIAGPWPDRTVPVEDAPPAIGNFGVDAALRAVHQYNFGVFEERARFGMQSLPVVPCVDDPGMGVGLVGCEGLPPETEVVGFPVGYCEVGLYRDPTEHLADFFGMGPELVAVVEAPPGPHPWGAQYQYGDYWAVYRMTAAGGNTQPAGRLHIDQFGAIKGIWYGCGDPVEAHLAFEGVPLPVLLDAR